MTSDAIPPLKVYIASITGNTEVRKHIQRSLMILDGLGVPFKAIDITVRGNEEEKEFMREHSKKDATGILPPQFFYNNEYLGNFADFDEAVETNMLEEFLRLIPNDIPDATSSKTADDESKSRETSAGNEDEEDEEEDEEEEGEDEDGEDKENEDATESATFTLGTKKDDEEEGDEGDEAEEEDEGAEGEDEEEYEDEEGEEEE